MKERQKYLFNMFYFAVLFLWPVIKTFFFQLDGAGRVESVMTILAIIVNGVSLFRGPGVMKVWFFWVIYCLVNLGFKGYYHDYPFFWWMMTQLVCPLVAMLVMYNCAIYNKDKLIHTTFIYFLIFVFVGAVQMVQLESERFGNGMGNSYLNNAIFIMPFLSLILRKHKDVFPYYLIIAFLFVVILLSAERKAMIGLIIMIMALIIARNSRRKAKIVLVFFILIIALYWGASYLIDNTLVGNRFNDQFAETTYEDNLFLTLMGDRASMYENGYLIFLQHPWTGIGLTNFESNPLNIKGFMLHSEYMVELTECGIIGSFLFLFFYFSMVYRIIKMLRNKPISYEAIILAGGLLSIIEINFSSWTYDYPYYFMFFGLLFASYDLFKKKNK